MKLSIIDVNVCLNVVILIKTLEIDWSYIACRKNKS